MARVVVFRDGQVVDRVAEEDPVSERALGYILLSHVVDIPTGRDAIIEQWLRLGLKVLLQN